MLFSTPSAKGPGFAPCLFASLLLGACTPNGDTHSATVVCGGPASDPDMIILPLGDSLTRGKTGEPSYRYYLEQMMLSEGITPEFLGTMYGGGGSLGDLGINFDEARFADFAACSHEGHGGYTWAELLAELPSWVETYGEDPDLIFLQAGTNDAFFAVPIEESVPAAEALVAWVSQTYPNSELVIGLPPALADAEQDALRAELTAILRLSFAEHIVIDLDEIIDPELQLIADGIHLTADGEEAMAQALWAATP